MAEKYESMDGLGCPTVKDAKLPDQQMPSIPQNTMTKEPKQDKPKS